jgi:hypothetical protein
MTYYFVEKPIRANGKSSLKIAVLTIFITALGLAGFAVFQNNGVPSRQAAQADGVNVWNNSTFRKSCEFITDTEEQDDWCNMGNAPHKPPIALLVGDSVGNGFAPMLQSYAKKNDDKSFVFQQVGRGGCHGFPQIGMPHCETLVAATDKFIANTPSIHTVIMASNWSIYSHGFVREGLSDITGQQFKAAFEERVSHYQKLGKRVIVFWAPPVGANPRDCVVRPIRLTDKTKCVFQRADNDNLEHNYRAIFAPFLAQQGIPTFDPVKYLCDEKTCKITDGTQIYYLDHEHFSVFGGQYLAKVANDELKQLLSPSAQ